MRAGPRLAGLALAALLTAGPAAAVERKPASPAPAETKTPPARPDKPPEPQSPAPPYEPQLLRLAEIMGALAYLRDLCGAGDGAEYRAKMSALLEAEGKVQERRERLAGAYNRGYLGYETSYSQCTPNAREAIARFVAEGARIARDISYRFGGT